MESTCPHCQARYRVPPVSKPRVAVCTKCGQKFTVYPAAQSGASGGIVWDTGGGEGGNDNADGLSRGRVLLMAGVAAGVLLAAGVVLFLVFGLGGDRTTDSNANADDSAVQPGGSADPASQPADPDAWLASMRSDIAANPELVEQMWLWDQAIPLIARLGDEAALAEELARWNAAYARHHAGYPDNADMYLRRLIRQLSWRGRDAEVLVLFRKLRDARQRARLYPSVLRAHFRAGDLAGYNRLRQTALEQTLALQSQSVQRSDPVPELAALFFAAGDHTGGEALVRDHLRARPAEVVASLLDDYDDPAAADAVLALIDDPADRDGVLSTIIGRAISAGDYERAEAQLAQVSTDEGREPLTHRLALARARSVPEPQAVEAINQVVYTVRRFFGERRIPDWVESRTRACLEAYCAVGRPDLAEQWVREYSEKKQDRQALGPIVIRGYGRLGRIDDARRLRAEGWVTIGYPQEVYLMRGLLAGGYLDEAIEVVRGFETVYYMYAYDLCYAAARRRETGVVVDWLRGIDRLRARAMGWKGLIDGHRARQQEAGG